MTNDRSRRRQVVLHGTVVSDKMDKTVVVAITRLVPHPLYGKVLRRITKVKAHDERNAARVGDRVKIVYSRPISKTKHWRVAAILEQGEQAAQVGLAHTTLQHGSSVSSE
ncbi:MAG: 30S ribosomal protein S17 [Nitrospirae bacterium]|nr:MAG: 30S ribosomal protein S17 [Nitrospirota bacterium]